MFEGSVWLVRESGLLIMMHWGAGEQELFISSDFLGYLITGSYELMAERLKRAFDSLC